ncbi:hypothetical protein ZHAS_00015687 [Anopheles sinensis]|uniref:Uncharacterized protein n=1 Tax=Anopheles sinensis TaxID=74873 RepID=A0A084WBQ1_ANOSI|nr:hypothetical protein ZHAS_00015687 [Anopheles sinensis]
MIHRLRTLETRDSSLTKICPEKCATSTDEPTLDLLEVITAPTEILPIRGPPRLWLCAFVQVFLSELFGLRRVDRGLPIATVDAIVMAFEDPLGTHSTRAGFDGPTYEKNVAQWYPFMAPARTLTGSRRIPVQVSDRR